MGKSRSSFGDIAFKSLTAALGLATIYLTATFSVNVYRGLAWHNAQTFWKRDLQVAREMQTVMAAGVFNPSHRWQKGDKDEANDQS